MKKHNEYILIASLFTIIMILLFRNFIFGENIFVSADTLAPQAIKQSIKNSLDSVSLWFPYIFSGMPTIHSLLNTNNYYLPHHLINFFHDLGMPWIWNFLFHYIFSAIGMYSLLRFLKQPKITSFLSSTLFSLSPYMIAYLVHGHGSQIMTASYIPWIILFLFKIHNKNSIKNYCLLALLVGLQLQRGHIQIVYYTWMMIGLFIIINTLIILKDRKTDLKKYFYNQFIIISSIILGFLTSLSIYLPIFNYTALSTRGSDMGGFGIEKATQWSLNFKEVTTFILPNAYGFGGRTYWGYLPFTDFPNYIGPIVILFALIGIYTSDIKKEYKLFFLFTIVLSFLISLGHNLINFYKIFYNYLPFFNKFRVPIFILILFQFSVYIFSAIGLTKLPDLIQSKSKRTIIYISLIFILGVYILFSFKNPQLFRYEQYNIQDTEILDNIKDVYIRAFHDQGKNSNPSSIDYDIKLINQWLDHEYKILKSYIAMDQYSNTSFHNISPLYRSTLYRILEKTNNDVNNTIKQIKKGYYIIILQLLILLGIIYIYYNYNLSKKYFFILISLIIISDYLKVDSEIIKPRNHIPHKKIVQNKEYLDMYLSYDEVIKFLKKDNQKFRILDKTGSYNRNRWAAFNIETIDGYHPAKINAYDKLLNKIKTKNGGVYHQGLIQLLNIKYIIHNKDGLIQNFEIIENEYNKKNTFGMSFFNNKNYNTKDVYIYKNKNFLNRIFIPKKISILDNNDKVLNKIINKDFNPEELSYINRNDLKSTHLNQLDIIEYNHDFKIDLISWNSDEIKFKIDTKSMQLVIFSEIFHPGWVLTDSNIEIFKVNGLFRGIIVPPGNQEIIMKYQPLDIIVGKWISIITYIFLISIYSYSIYRRKNAEL